MMRRFVVAAVMAVVAQSASAADMPDLPILRGSFGERPVAQRPLWQGFYVGGQASLGATSGEPTSLRDLTHKMLYGTTYEHNPETYRNVSEWPLFTNQSNKAGGVGGFIGYNMQWDDTVVGFEANYLRTGFKTFDSGSRTDSGVTYSGFNDTRLSDMGSIRVRGGYAWNGFLLPYGFIGLGLGIGSASRESNLYVHSSTGTIPSIPTYSLAEQKNNVLMYGYSVGAGVDMMLFAGLFGRLEWEYTKFAAPVETTVNTVRAGVGYKF